MKTCCYSVDCCVAADVGTEVAVVAVAAVAVGAKAKAEAGLVNAFNHKTHNELRLACSAASPWQQTLHFEFSFLFFIFIFHFLFHAMLRFEMECCPHIYY